MWKTLGNIRETVREGLQELGRDAIKESSLIKSSVVENVAPVAKSITSGDFLGKKSEARKVFGLSVDSAPEETKDVKGKVGPSFNDQSDADQSAAVIPVSLNDDDGWDMDDLILEAEPELSPLDDEKVVNVADVKISTTAGMEPVSLEDDKDYESSNVVLLQPTSEVSSVVTRTEDEDQIIKLKRSESDSSVSHAEDSNEHILWQQENEKLQASKIEQLEKQNIQLRSMLKKQNSEKERMAERISRSEDGLEKALADNKILLAKIVQLEESRDTAVKMAEDELHSAQLEYQRFRERTLSAEDKANKMERDMLASKRDRQNLEQKVKSITSSLEKRMEGLIQEVKARDKEIEELREENEGMGKGFSQLKLLFQEVTKERDGLSESLADREKDLADTQKDLEISASECEGLRRDSAESSARLAEAQAEIQKLQGAVSGKSALAATISEERSSLEASLKAATESAQAAAAEAAALKAKCENLQSELKLKSSNLSQAEAELTLANEKVLAAEGEADEAKRLKAEAEGTSEQLKIQTERRAKVFNAAVKAAVNKIQTELENERDEAMARIKTLEAESVAHVLENREIQVSLNSALERVAALSVELEAREEEGRKREKQILMLEAEVVEVRDREKEASRKAAAAMEVADRMTKKMAEIEGRHEELKADVESANQDAANVRAELMAERENWRDNFATFQQEKAKLKMDALEASTKAGSEASSLKLRIVELESRLTLAEDSSRSSLHVPKRNTSALEGLGLEKVNVYRGAESPFVDNPKSTKVAKRGAFDDVDRTAGRISKRSFIVGVYIVLLHMMVMVSFTHRSTPCPGMGAAGDLPG